MSIKHKVVWHLLRPPVALFLRVKFGYTSCRAKTRELPENYIVLSNHATDYDPLMVATSFRRQMYCVGSAHISRWKRAYPIIKFLVDPIMRKKGMSASHAIIDILRKVRHGERVFMFAEGVRTWDGVTCPIAPTTGQLIKKAGCALITYRLVGGYFLSPGWSAHTRRGYSRGDIVNVYTKEQLADMTVDEINEAIVRDLYVDAYARQLESPKPYYGKGLAEGIENFIFICPECGKYETITSHGNEAKCSACGMTITFDKYGMLSGTRFKTVRELSDWQKGHIAKSAKQRDVYTAQSAVLYLVDEDMREVQWGEASFGADGFTMGSLHIPLSEITDMAFHGRRKVVFSSGKDYYELVPNEGVNVIKFVWLYKELQRTEALEPSLAK